MTNMATNMTTFVLMKPPKASAGDVYKRQVVIRAMELPIMPVAIGFILGPIFEQNLSLIHI